MLEAYLLQVSEVVSPLFLYFCARWVAAWCGVVVGVGMGLSVLLCLML